MEMPFAGVPVIVCFGVPYRLDGERFETFVAGMTDRPVATEFTGAAGGVQIDLTPLGARRILGIPMEELTRRVVAVEELLGRELVERLRDAPGWRERFALLDAALLRRVDAGPAPAPEVAWSYARLAAADGRVAAGALADEVRLEPPPPGGARLAARRRGLRLRLLRPAPPQPRVPHARRQHTRRGHKPSRRGGDPGLA